MPQPGQELDAAGTVLRQNQRPDHASQGEAAIEDGQVKPLDQPGLFPEQVHGQLALGAERFAAAGLPGPLGQLRFAEVKLAGERQEPGRLLGVLQQGAQDDPVVSPHGGGPVGAAGGVFVEGAGAPDVRAAAMDLGVIESRDMVAVPEPTGGCLDQAGQTASDAVGVPGAVFGERFHGLPVEGAFHGQGRLGDGVFFDIEGHGGDPLGEAAVSGPREAPGEATEQACQWTKAA